MTTPNNETLALCGTGKTGRRVVERLRRRGVPTRVGSRSADPPFDWQDAATWPAALRGVVAIYVAYHPDLAVPGAPEAVAELADLARASGVRRLVLLSGRGEREAERAEKAVRDAGVPWTIVRCSWFSQNFSEGYLLDGLLAGEIALPTDVVREPFLDADDVADVATAALIDERHAGQAYELTGPRLLTFADAVGEIGRATGRPMRYRPLPLAEYEAALAAEHVPADVIALLAYLFGEVLDGRNAHLADGVVRALGRPPRDFTEYARAAAATGVWTTS